MIFFGPLKIFFKQIIRGPTLFFADNCLFRLGVLKIKKYLQNISRNLSRSRGLNSVLKLIIVIEFTMFDYYDRAFKYL